MSLVRTIIFVFLERPQNNRFTRTDYSEVMLGVFSEDVFGFFS